MSTTVKSTKISKSAQSLSKMSPKSTTSKIPFSKLSKAEKRVAVAKDVIKSLKSQKFIAEQGTYCTLDFVDSEDFVELHNYSEFKTVQLQELLKNRVKTCNVCAIGAIFLTKVKFVNKFEVDVDGNKLSSNSQYDLSYDDESLCKNLKDIFSGKQLRLIEFAFEGVDRLWLFRELKDKWKYEEYREKFANNTDCMVAIMKNIIKNEGTFKL